ncbi:MAG: HD domain-containing protein [Acidobacteriota bacterium]
MTAGESVSSPEQQPGEGVSAHRPVAIPGAGEDRTGSVDIGNTKRVARAVARRRSASGIEETRMALSRDEAWKHLCEWTLTEALRKHARAVELVMRAAAHRYGDGEQDVERWGLAGMLHDADYEQWPEEHPRRIVAWLTERGEEEIAHAVSAHHTGWNVPYETVLDRALLACDELTGFIVACCLVRPAGVATLTPKSVKKKLKTRSFAAKVERSEVTAGAELLGVDLTEHIRFIIETLQPRAAEFGIEGTA